MSFLNVAGGFPLALSVGFLSAGFNWNFADWTAGIKSSDSRPIPRESELKRHGVLLGLAALHLLLGGFTSRSHMLLLRGALETSAKTPRTMAGIGLAWGGALTIGTAVVDEWDHYDDGWKVAITGGSLVGLVTAASFL